MFLQNEIRRLKDAYKAASQERKSMLNQQLEIQRIRESTQKIWNKVETLDPACTTRRRSLEENDNDEVVFLCFFILSLFDITFLLSSKNLEIFADHVVCLQNPFKDNIFIEIHQS